MTVETPKRLRPCPLCGGLDRKLQFTRDDWDIVECAHCRMVFLGAELTYAAQLEDHDWSDDHSKENSRRKEKSPLLMFFSRLTRPLRPEPTERLLNQTLRRRREGRLVDFGCGDGRFLEHSARFFDVMGIEISPASAEMARRRMTPGRILEGPVTEMASRILPEEAFDVVTQFGYIEHEWQPLAGLRAAFRVLKPGGVTVIKTPNFASWNRRVMGMNWCGYHIPAHCNYFTPATLGRMLSQAGFEPLSLPLFDRFPTSDSLWMAARKSG